MNKILNNNSNNEMKKTINELINYEISEVQQYLKQLKEYNSKCDEHLFHTQNNNMYYQQNQTPNNNAINQTYINNNVCCTIYIILLK